MKRMSRAHGRLLAYRWPHGRCWHNVGPGYRALAGGISRGRRREWAYVITLPTPMLWRSLKRKVEFLQAHEGDRSQVRGVLWQVRYMVRELCARYETNLRAVRSKYL